MCNFFYIVSHDFRSKLIINVASNKHIILLLYLKKIFIFEIPVRRKMLHFSPATNILIIQPWGNTWASYQPTLKVEFSPSHCSHVVPFSLSLVEERGKVLPNGNWSVDLGSLVDKHLLWWVYTQRNWQELKRSKPI